MCNFYCSAGTPILIAPPLVVGQELKLCRRRLLLQADVLPGAIGLGHYKCGGGGEGGIAVVRFFGML